MAEIATFWNGKHPLSEKSTELYSQLVPDSGNSTCAVGELLRASTKINWDWFNNGWGCNNWSGAVVFLRNNMDHLELDPEQFKKLNKALDYVYEYSHGEPASHLNYNGVPCKFVTELHELVVQGILNTSPVDWAGNTEDMYDFTEEDYVPEEDDEEEEW